jgi:hypothetical protein
MEGTHSMNSELRASSTSKTRDGIPSDYLSKRATQASDRRSHLQELGL